jgi:hypothetical protein
MKRITFNVPVFVKGSADPVIEPREGYRIWLRIAGRKRPFVLQIGMERPHILADYASGYRLANLSGRMLEHFVRNPYRHRETLNVWRQMAMNWLDDAVFAKGSDVIVRKLDAVPTINR